MTGRMRERKEKNINGKKNMWGLQIMERKIEINTGKKFFLYSATYVVHEPKGNMTDGDCDALVLVDMTLWEHVLCFLRDNNSSGRAKVSVLPVC